MKTNKKILMLVVSLLISALISAGISGGLLTFFNINFWLSFWFFITLQIGGSIWLSNFYESNKIIAAVREYASKPYKKYMLPLNCAHCGHKNEIEIDLSDTEYRCENCKRYNGIHVNFMSAAITEPIDQIQQ